MLIDHDRTPTAHARRQPGALDGSSVLVSPTRSPTPAWRGARATHATAEIGVTPPAIGRRRSDRGAPRRRV